MLTHIYGIKKKMVLMNLLIGSKQRRAICQGFNLKPEVEKQTFILSLESNKVKINAERIQKPLI